MFTHLNNTYKAIILAVIGFGAFSLGDASTKFLTHHYSVFEIIGIKALFVMVIILCFSAKLGGLKKTLKTKKLPIQIMRGLVNTIVGVTAIYCFAKLPLAQAYTLFFAAPFITTLLAIPLFKERVDRRGWLAIITGFIGVLVVLRPGFAAFNIWTLVGLLSAFLIAVLFLLAKALDDDETILSLPFFPMASDVILLLPFVWPALMILSPFHILIFVFSSLMIIIGYIGISLAFQMASASIVGPFHYTQMIWAVFLGYFLFAELPDIWTLLGAAIIIGSGIYLIERERSLLQ